MVYGNRRSNYVLRNHASSPIGLSAISSISIRLMRSIVRFQRFRGGRSYSAAMVRVNISLAKKGLEGTTSVQPFSPPPSLFQVTLSYIKQQVTNVSLTQSIYS